MLSDGKWHTVEEIRQKTQLGENQVQRLTEFLREYDFIIVDETRTKIRVNETAQGFLTQKTNA